MALVLSLASVLLSVMMTEAQKPPNILFFLVDDLGWNDVGFHGASDAYTPFINKLAKEESLILSHAYAQHYCTQSRAALLTGRYPMRMGLQHRVVQPDMPYGIPFTIPYPTGKSDTQLPIRTLPEILKENGYETHLVGKWDLGFAHTSMLPINRGFDSFFGYLNGDGDHYDHYKKYKRMFGYDLRNNTEPVMALNQYSSYLYGNVTRDLLRDYGNQTKENAAATAPFFIEHAFQVVHSPNQAPGIFIRIYQRLKNKKRETRVAMSSAADAVISQLIDTLKTETDLWDNTLIIFQSDNGGPVIQSANNYPLRGGKFSLYEGGVRTPTFVSGGVLKENRRGQRSDKLMHISDWMPTLMELAGITNEDEYVATLDGVSQLACIQDDTDAVRDMILHNVDPMSCHTPHTLCGAIRKGKWKLALGREVTAPLNVLAGWTSLADVDEPDMTPTVDCGSGKQPKFVWDPFVPPFNRKPLLFDIIDDPCEYKDLSEEYPDIRDQLLNELIEWNQSMVIPAQLVYKADPEGSDPHYLGGFWGPWLDKDDSDNSDDDSQVRTEL